MVTSNKSNHFLVENEFKKLEKFDVPFFRGKNYFEEDGTQNYVVFQLKTINSADNISEWKSKTLSNESYKTPNTYNNSLNPLLDYVKTKIRVKFSGSCLKQVKATLNPRATANMYIVYEISKNYNISSYPTLENCLFRAVSFTNNADIDYYKYSGYGIGFDRKGEFSFGSRGFGINCIIFGADLTNSSHANNRKNNILVPDKHFTQGVNVTTIYAEQLYKINFTENNKKFCLSLHYNGGNSYLFVNRTEIIKFKAKDSEIVPYPLCLGNISKDFSVDNMKKTRLHANVYDFSVDYSAITNDKILNYLMRQTNNII